MRAAVHAPVATPLSVALRPDRVMPTENVAQAVSAEAHASCRSVPRVFLPVGNVLEIKQLSTLFGFEVVKQNLRTFSC